MKVVEEMKRIPLGIPLTVASLGTLASLVCGKKWHVGFGAAWTILSLLHGLQHFGKMKKDARSLFPVGKRSAALDTLLRSLRVASYIPGRVRLYSQAFLGNESFNRSVEEYVESFTGVKKAAINPWTGSLLIRYDPEELRERKGLAALEKRLKAYALRK